MNIMTASDSQYVRNNPQEALIKRACLKLVFIRKLLLTGFLQTLIVVILFMSYVFTGLKLPFPYYVAFVALVGIIIYSLLAFFLFKRMSKSPQNKISLVVFTILELLLILSGKDYFDGNVFSVITLLTLGSIGAVYLVFLIYSLFIRKKMKPMIPLVIVLLIFVILLAMMLVYTPQYQIAAIVNCVGVIIFTVYIVLRLMYINKKFGNGYSGQAYYVLAIKMLTDAFLPILVIVLLVAAAIFLGDDADGCGTNNSCEDVNCDGCDCDCDFGCNDCICCFDNEDFVECCCIGFCCCFGAKQSRLVYDDLERFDNIPQCDFDVAPRPASHLGLEKVYD